MDGETKDSRKVQKADREKLRRGRLNEQFMELGKALDPDRPKNDKASILIDTIQMIKELTSQVDKLKSEYASLTEESRELIHEKNDLREEKASLKSDVENLNSQYSQRVRSMYPWTGMDQTVLMPLPIPIPSGPVPLQPYPYFGSQNPPPNPYTPYMARDSVVEQLSRYSSSGRDGESGLEKNDDSNDVTTDLELKTPGSNSDQNDNSPLKRRREKRDNDPSSSSGCCSSSSVRSISSITIGGGK
ncbi:hypothetical protein M569_08377, partial [Genlisea aurea]